MTYEAHEIVRAMRVARCTDEQIKDVALCLSFVTAEKLAQAQNHSFEYPPKTVTQKDDLGGLFARFWQAWPNKVGKPAAERAFKKVASEIDAILAGVERYVRTKPVDRPWLNPSTFLNQRRWEDEPAPLAQPLYDMRKDGLALLLNEISRRENEPRQSQIAGKDVCGVSEQHLLGWENTGND